MKDKLHRLKIWLLLRIMWSLAWIQRRIHAALGPEYISQSGYRAIRSYESQFFIRLPRTARGSRLSRRKIPVVKFSADEDSDLG